MPSAALFALGLGLLLYALVSDRAGRDGITAPMGFVALGLALALLGNVDIGVDSSAIHDLAEAALVIALFTDASRIDVRRLRAQHGLPVRLLTIGLPGTMILGTVVAMILFPDLGLWPAAVLAVMLAPTDAALGQAVVSDRAVPARVRQALNVESGLNDGLAFPALLIAVSLAAADGGRGIGGWAGFIAAQLLLAPLVGGAVALLCARAIRTALGRGWMDETFLRISTLALPLLAYAGAEAVTANGFIAAFCCGLVTATRDERLRDAIADFAEAEGQLVTLIVFAAFGAVLLPGAWEGWEWRHVVYAVLSLTVLRMAPVWLSLLGTGLRRETVLFLGWFGPRGLASVIYLLLVLEENSFAGLADIEATTLLTVLLSVVLHGATAGPLARRYGKAVGDAPRESQKVHEFRLGRAGDPED
ncbi:sodium/proton antiporter (CPA1 family) [Hasllibacter halocynthiae]|uniref:Sodium/proton antiporter (CPA1 family) n=1 Tax=Hasllibacter halocynthiae TaxID=595589 RepID=A0A2T0X9Z3_9RHOB|nr:cation:proton antiporter [Hasllibacter halocynthiae]PRY95759.1 sodium/proton antiporter (CPA1 family) [Hasllibacter halocynthiae]